MPILYVRDVPGPIYDQARKIAADQGRSLSAFVVTVLQQAIEDDKVTHARAKVLAGVQRRRRPLAASAPDSAAVIREIRDGHE